MAEGLASPVASRPSTGNDGPLSKWASLSEKIGDRAADSAELRRPPSPKKMTSMKSVSSLGSSFASPSKQRHRSGKGLPRLVSVLDALQDSPEEEDDDVDPEEIMRLLERAQSRSAVVNGFDETELRALARSMSVLPFAKDEMIMQKGEHASWVGIVLDGQLEARDDDGRVLGHAEVGDICGEMALFCGGTRGADMAGASAGSIAAVTVTELEAFCAERPETVLKLVKAFGHAALDKLGAIGAVEKGDVIWDLQRKEVKHALLTSFKSRLTSEAGFTSDEFDHLVAEMTFCSFDKEQRLMSRGERANYVGVVLSGALIAGTSQHGIDIKPPELVGEVAFFRSGIRSADVFGASNGIMGGISYEHLQRCSRYSPVLAMRMLRWLGASAVSRVSPAVAAAALIEAKGMNRRSEGTVREQAAVELLFRTKMKRERAKTERVESAERETSKKAETALHEAANSKHLERKWRKLTKELHGKLEQSERRCAELKISMQREEDKCKRALEQREDLLEILRERSVEIEELKNRLSTPFEIARQKELEELHHKVAELTELKHELEMRISTLSDDLHETTMHGSKLSEVLRERDFKISSLMDSLADAREQLGHLKREHDTLHETVLDEGSKRNELEDTLMSMRMQSDKLQRLHEESIEREASLERVAKLQRLAAKTLGLVYLTRVHAMRKRLQRGEAAAEVQKQALAELRRVKRMQELELDALRRQTGKLVEESAPASRELSRLTDLVPNLRAEIDALKRQRAEALRDADEARAKIDAAETEAVRLRTLLQQLKARSKREHEQLRGEAERGRAQLQIRDELLAAFDTVQSRLAELEAGFGALMNPTNPNGQSLRNSLLDEMSKLSKQLNRLGARTAQHRDSAAVKHSTFLSTIQPPPQPAFAARALNTTISVGSSKNGTRLARPSSSPALRPPQAARMHTSQTPEAATKPLGKDSTHHVCSAHAISATLSQNSPQTLSQSPGAFSLESTWSRPLGSPGRSGTLEDTHSSTHAPVVADPQHAEDIAAHDSACNNTDATEKSGGNACCHAGNQADAGGEYNRRSNARGGQCMSHSSSSSLVRPARQSAPSTSATPWQDISAKSRLAARAPGSGSHHCKPIPLLLSLVAEPASPSLSPGGNRLGTLTALSDTPHKKGTPPRLRAATTSPRLSAWNAASTSPSPEARRRGAAAGRARS